MSYQRFRLPEAAIALATVATLATDSADEPGIVATVASVATPYLENADFDERAAIAEFEAVVPREWAEGFARLDTAKPLLGFSCDRWRQLIDDGGRFLDQWANQAAALGWTAVDVFGLHRDAPAARLDGIGLVALIRGGEIVAIDSDHATIRMPSGNCLTYYLRRPRPDAVAAWDLDKTQARRI